ncbi:MAG: LpxL/LpxP family acyltransferase [Candidatus Helarchaeota archaeon]
MDQKEIEKLIERDRPTDSPYSYKSIVKAVRFLEKKKLFRFTIKIPHFVIRLLSYFAASVICRIGNWKRNVSKSIDVIFRNRLKEKYGEKITRQIKKSINFINIKNMARVFAEDFFFLPSLVCYKNLHKKIIRLAPNPEKNGGLKRILEAWNEGKGVVLIGCHQGAFLIMTMSLGLYRRSGEFPPLASLAIEKGSMDAYVEYMKKVINVIELEQGQNVDRKTMIYNVVKNKGILMEAIDRGHKNYPKIPLFGKPAQTPIGPAFLNVKYGTPVLPAYNLPYSKKTGWTIYIGKPLQLKKYDPNSKLSEKEVIKENSKIINKALEKILIKSYHTWMYLMLFRKLKDIK